MEDNTPAVSEEEIEDRSLLDNTAEEVKSTDESTNTAEETKDEGADDETKKEDDTKPDDAKDTEAKDESKPDDQETQEKQPSPAARAYQERQRSKQEIARDIDKNYGPKTKEDFVEEGLNPLEAKFEALQAQVEYERERNAIVELNHSAVEMAQQVITEMPIYRETNPDGTPNPDYVPEFANKVTARYMRDARVQVDADGNILNADVPIYDYYKEAYDDYMFGATKGSQKAQNEALQMLSRAENPGGSSSATSGNSLDDLEERLGNMVIT